MNRALHVLHASSSGHSAAELETPEALERNFAGVLIKFGFTDKECFKPLMATVAFVNAVVCARVDPEAAARLDAMLRDSVPDETVEEVRKALHPDIHKAPDFPTPMQRVFVSLVKSRPEEWPLFRLALRLGLTCLEHAPQLGVATLDVPRGMHEENEFLAGRLGDWAPRGFRRPNQPVFLEFLEWRYARKPVECAILSAEAEAVIEQWPKETDALYMPIWAWAGWLKGAAFVRHRSMLAPALFDEMRPETFAGLRDAAQRAFPEPETVDADRTHGS